MKRIIFITGIALFFFYFFISCRWPEAKANTGHSEKQILNSTPVKNPDSLIDITINVVGDLMCHKPQVTNATISPGHYDFNPSFTYVKKYLEDADITIGNLETTFAGSSEPYSGYPAFNSPDAYSLALKENGFDFLVTANNHSMDTKEEGLLRTIEVIRKAGLGSTGTFISQRDKDSIRILDIKGLKLGILNYTYGTNGKYPSAEHKYMLNVTDSADVTQSVKQAYAKGADIVMVFYHMGTENITEPTTGQKEAVRYALDAGAKIVIGAHPHVIGPTKVFQDSVTHETSFVAYSLGNFLSNQYWRYTDAGVILTLHLQKNMLQEKTRFVSAEYLPTWVYRGDGGKKQHIIFPVDLVNDTTTLPDFLHSSHIQKLKEAQEDTKTILTKYNADIQKKSLKN